ncbi:MAG TPA: YhdH/YhfP family quinone oxidoreductase [Pseudomonadales bacterium]|jgi:acrylyl-CoA reductase (NADPH)|nr:YhdH/YhfP family quinone oxidoreductase [Pseudomonadales bacterium]
MSKFSALVVEKTADEKFTRRVLERSTDALPAGDVLVDVRYSSLNYKDALSATGNPGVTRNFPHTPGIDAAGTVIESVSTQFKPGDEVIVIGFDLGMNTPGGFGQRIRVPAGWIVPRPAGLPLEQSMILGTAGFTAALAVDKLEASGMRTNGGPVLVTGATGGVGSVAVMLLTHLGYEVAAVTGKAAQHDFLKKLGAKEILGREALLEGANRPMLKERWGGVVDTVGGDILFNAVKSLKYGCSLAACGLVASPQFAATVLPFILRHVNLLGIDSVQLPLAEKARIWNKLAGVWRLDGLAALKVGFTLASISSGVDRILAGEMVGRGVLDLRA